MFRCLFSASRLFYVNVFRISGKTVDFRSIFSSGHLTDSCLIMLVQGYAIVQIHFCHDFVSERPRRYFWSGGGGGGGEVCFKGTH